MPSFFTENEQERFLEEGRNSVRQQVFYMKRAMDKGNLVLTLKHASEMLRELRTSLLSPKNYYELYMMILDEMRHLELYFEELTSSEGITVRELYEKVQSCGNVLPRLYLLITVGSVYIRTKGAPAKDVLKDLVEMSKGVQHPLRGLFLRNYLSLMAKDKLPDEGSEYEGHGGTCEDAIEFLLLNFAETNRLWIRMQHQASSNDRKKREQERQELRILVSSSLVRLSQLEGVNKEKYEKVVLPRLLTHIIECKDKIAQQYLMDCIIQVFPDEYHLHCFEPFLESCLKMHVQVDIRTIWTTLMERLTHYALENKASMTSSGGSTSASPEGGSSSTSNHTLPSHTFEILSRYVERMLFEDDNRQIETHVVFYLLLALLKFSMVCFHGHREYIQHVVDSFYSYCKKKMGSKKFNEQEVEQLSEFLTTIASSNSSEMKSKFVELNHLKELYEFLPLSQQKTVAKAFLDTVLEQKWELSDIVVIEKLFGYLIPLTKDPATMENSPIKGEFEMEQQSLGKLVHLMHNSNADELFKIYSTTRKFFGQGGIKRIQFTLVPLIFATLRLTVLLHKKEFQGEKFKSTPRKALQFVHEIVTALASNCPSLALKLFLQCAQTADLCQFEAIAYEFITQAFILYEDEMSCDSRTQLSALELMIGTLSSCRNLSADNFDTLSTKTTQYSAKVLKKTDQCWMVMNCAHLFWMESHPDETKSEVEGSVESKSECEFSAKKDGKRVLECLQRALKTADVCVNSSPTNATLFVEILDKYVAFHQKKSPQITLQYISGLIALIKEHLESMDSGTPARGQVETHYHNTLDHMKRNNILQDM